MARRPAPSDRKPSESAPPSDAGGDVLSEVLRAVRLRGAVFFLVDATEPWVAEAPKGIELAPFIMPGVQHLLEYHIVTRGSCFGGLIGHPPIELHAGDVLVFPQGDAHVMTSTPGMRGTPARSVLESVIGRPPYNVRVGGNDASAPRAEVVCGFLGCDVRPFNPLLTALPRMLHLRASSDPADAFVASLIAVALGESRAQRAGGEVVLARISELLFVEAVRRHLRALPEDNAGWLAGLRDPLTGKALNALHTRPARDWTLDELARVAHTSRSVLVERFTHFVGAPPMQYLAQWRMQIAGGMLAGGHENIATIAQEVGYGSEAAFSRAFKKLVGVSPAAWRAEQSTRAAARTQS